MNARVGQGARSPRRGRWRLALMLPAALCLLAGLDAALILLEVPAPLPITRWGTAHGLVLVFGFVGSLISLERAVALKHPAGYASPLLLSLGGLAMLTGFPREFSALLLVLGMAGMLITYIPLWRRQRAHAVLIQMVGALAGVAGTILWLGGIDTSLLLPWLTAFLVLTIAGERVELARLQLAAGAENQALVLSGLLLVAATASILWVETGTTIFGVSLILLVLWLVRNDVARRTINAVGAARFMAGCLLAGYFWLLAAAVIFAFGYPGQAAAYDAVIHAVFLGFVMSMIMAHAPTILPAVLAIDLPYRPVLWVPAMALHLGLVLRLFLGDALGYQDLWLAGGLLNVLALVLFVLVAAYSAIRGTVPAKPGTAHMPAGRGGGLQISVGSPSTGMTGQTQQSEETEEK